MPAPGEQRHGAVRGACPAAALDLLALARDRLGETISAFELIHRQGFDFLPRPCREVRQPFADAARMVRADRGRAGGGLDPARRRLEALFAAALEAGWSGRVIAQIRPSSPMTSGPCAK